jgi:hypothetical protein
MYWLPTLSTAIPIPFPRGHDKGISLRLPLTLQPPAPLSPELRAPASLEVRYAGARSPTFDLGRLQVLMLLYFSAVPASRCCAKGLAACSAEP